MRSRDKKLKPQVVAAVVFCVITLFCLSGCNNPWMAAILKPKGETAVKDDQTNDPNTDDPVIDIPLTVSGVSLNKTVLTLEEGETETLTATVEPADAANKAVSWSSSVPAVAGVSSGTVIAVSAGSAIITVSTEDGGYTASCEVTVTEPPYEGPPGTGGPNDPFIVHDVETLRHVGKPESGEYDLWGVTAHYKQVRNIDLTGTGDWWPIGGGVGAANYFEGSYDGGNRTITGLSVNGTYDDFWGMFGMIQPDAVVQNVRLVNCSVTSISDYGTGGIASTNIGAVRNCHVVSGTIDGGNNTGGIVGANGGTVKDCSFSGLVQGADNTGGIVGSSSGTVEYCYSTGNITGSGDNTGGIAGDNSGTVEYCYSTGGVSGNATVGGIAGNIGTGYVDGDGLVQNCYSTGDVTGSGNYVGGVAGYIIQGTIEYCYFTGAVSGGNYIGGVVSEAGDSQPIIQNCVVLNPVIKADGTNINRVIQRYGTATNNYAREDMLLMGNGSPVTPNPGANGWDGEDITADDWNSATWWQYNGSNTDPNGPGFDPAVWDIANNRLPTLRNVGGTQNPAVK